MATSQPILTNGAKEAVRIIEIQSGGTWHSEYIPEDAINRAVRSGVLDKNGSGLSVNWDVAQSDSNLRHLDES